MKYKYLDHTADAMFECYGKTLEELFANAGLATFNLLTDIIKVKQIKSFKIDLSSNKLEKLLFDFLDELLFYLDTEHMLFSDFKNIIIKENNGEYTLSCTAIGDVASNYETHGDVKAPTYNEMVIKKTNKGFSAVVVVDI